MTRLASVVADVPALGRALTYSIPETLSSRLVVGSIVRIPLHGRRVRGWVVELDVDAPPGVRLAEIARFSGVGPDAEMIDLCRWAAWRWSGRLVSFLRAASPPHVVAAAARPARGLGRPRAGEGSTPALVDPVLAEALAVPRAIVRLPPVEDPLDFACEAVGAVDGPALVVCPSVLGAVSLARRLRARGRPVAVCPDDWAAAAAGGVTVVGARSAAFAPVPGLALTVVVDEHDEALQSEGSPTWHAREVCLERARRSRARALMLSPVPTLEAMSRSPVVTVSRERERAGWPIVEVIDRRDDDIGRTGLYSTRLVTMLRAARDPLCILNRTGRARLLACASCGTIARCEHCDAAVAQRDAAGTAASLQCPACDTERPVVCSSCGATRMKNLRPGVSRAAEELESLVGPQVRIGTEAALHDADAVDLVAFLDFDSEVLAPRYRAAEQALVLLARAARRLGPGGARDGARIVVQTRDPAQPVIQAALRADPSLVSDHEALRRDLLGYPPAATIAVVGGEAAAPFIEAVGAPPDVEIRSASDGEWLLRSRVRATLLDALAATPRPPGRLRLQVDPMRFR